MTGTANFDRYKTLTFPEREVLRLVAEGLTTAEIATPLGIDSQTAETHEANLTHKLGLHTRSELVRFALRREIITIDE